MPHCHKQETNDIMLRYRSILFRYNYNTTQKQGISQADRSRKIDCTGLAGAIQQHVTQLVKVVYKQKVMILEI